MTILSNNQKNIKIRFTNTVYKSYDKEENQECFNVNPPYISCSNKQDAERIQEEINTLVNKLSKELMK